MILLASTHAASVLEQLRGGTTARVSLDLGLSETEARAGGGGVRLSRDVTVSLDDLREIADCPDAVFSVSPDGVRKIARFSEATGRSYALRPTSTWPALEIGGILMHRVKDTDPKTDAEARLALISPLRGAVLDTCCGLGYTAIVAARTAPVVTTVEKDATVLEIARLNPYSRGLFEDARIDLVHGDSTELVRGLGDAGLDAVVHDPPTLSIAGEMYADAFYEQLYRVLRPGGRLLHYTGAPGSRHRRVQLPDRVARRLKRIGFGRVRLDRGTSCVVAARPRA